MSRRGTFLRSIFDLPSSQCSEGGLGRTGSIRGCCLPISRTSKQQSQPTIEHKKKGMGTAAGEEPPLADQKSNEVGVLTDLNPPAPSDAGGGGGSGDARAKTPESRGSGWMQGAEEVEALEGKEGQKAGTWQKASAEVRPPPPPPSESTNSPPSNSNNTNS